MQWILIRTTVYLMKCTAIFLFLVLSAPGGSAVAKHSHREYACKTPEIATSCYWTHGRLGANNGTPAFRLWKVGTSRLLGIYSGPEAFKRRYELLDNEHPDFPENIKRRFIPLKNRVFADFEVCPLEPERTGVMQAVCIESATNVVVVED